MRFWSFTGIRPAPYFKSTHTLSVFPPRVIQKARPPTGPSLRLGMAFCRRDAGLAWSTLITLGARTSF